MKNFLILLACSTISWFCLTAFKDIYAGDSQMEAAAISEDFQVGIPNTITYEFPELALEELSPREQTEQIRDWLLVAVLKGNNLPTAQLNEIMLDLPPVRYGYLNPVSNLDYGETRSRMIGDKSAVALVPRCESRQEHDHLCHIADALRKDLGAIPETIKVYVYDIAQSEGKATITKKNEVAGKTLFTSEAGYHEMPIKSLDDLKRFMNTIQDITYAKKVGYDKPLVLGGRALKARKYGNITVEDVAALWQSEEDIAKKMSAFERKWEAKINEAKDKWDAKLRQNPYNREEYQAAFSEEEKKISLEAAIEAKSLKLVDGSGFSLDPEGELYQYARYDGNLKGTIVGMHLFYTDLVAKIWGNNMYRSSPFDQIPEFKTNITIKPSLVFKEEISKFNKSRLWFGKDENGFQFASNKDELLFRRKGTRIYEASSENHMHEGEEVPETAAWSQPINWWNNHYEEIAAYEPEYEYLNEIMKWSVVIGWLNEQGSDKLIFLNSVPVNKNYWFPDWARNNTSLKFEQWNNINFYPKGFNGKKVECLPLLVSPFFKRFGEVDWFIYGGVSLFSKSNVKSLAALSDDIAPAIRRSIWNYGKSGVNEGLVSFKGTIFKPFNLSRFSKVDLIPESQIKLRNVFGEVKNGGFIKNLSSSENSLNVRLQQGQAQVGNLQVNKSGNGFDIGFQSMEMDQAMLLGRRMSDATIPEEVIGGMKGVKGYKNVGNNRFEVEFTGSQQVAEMEIAATNGVEIGSDVACRVAGHEPSSKIINIRWKSSGRGGPRMPEDPGLQKFSAGKYSDFSDYVTSKGDPVAYKKALEKEIKETLVKAKNTPDKALARDILNNLEHQFGSRPDILLEKGLNQLDNALGKIAAADKAGFQNALNDLPYIVDKPTGLRFFKEAVAKIDTRSANTAIKDCMKNMAAHAAGVVDRAFCSVVDFARVGSLKGFKKVRWSSKIANGKNQIRIDRSLVADHPYLSNVDWSPNVESTLRTIMELHPDAILVKIPRQKIGQFRLKVVLDETGAPELSIENTRVRYNGTGSGGGNDDDDDDEDEGYYLLVSKSKAE